MKKISIRFYEELNDLLPVDKQKTRFEHIFTDRPSVKDLMESLGVPHVEIDLILVNGKSVGFNYIVNNGDDISVYPVFETFDITGAQHLRPEPLRNKKFILDVHLGTLAKYIRMLGFDTLYQNTYTDEEIVKTASEDNRTILTKDRGILKRNDVTRGYYVRNILPEKQLEEITRRFFLKKDAKEFTRCLECNSVLEKARIGKIEELVPPKVRERQDVFCYCKECNKVYWKGSHYEKMIALIEKIFAKK